MLSDTIVRNAFLNIAARNEQMLDDRMLITSYYNNNVIEALTNINHQLVIGRRGTGKTHVLRVLNHGFKTSRDSHSIYIDCRLFGSASIFMDAEKPLKSCCVHLFRDFLLGLYKELSKYIVAKSNDEETMFHLSRFADAILEVEQITDQMSVEENEIEVGNNQKQNSIGFSFKSASLLDLKSERKTEEKFEKEGKIKYELKINENVIFPNLSDCLSNILSNVNLRLYIVIDEWSSIPLYLQPYFAEFLKRSILVCGNVTLKTAVISNQYSFSKRIGQGYIGIELGAEISNSVNMDETFTFDINPPKSIYNLANITMRHLVAEVKVKYLEEKYDIDANDKSDQAIVSTIVKELFDDYKTCVTLMKASEGNTRDYINLLCKCIAESRSKNEDKISLNTVHFSVRSWFNNDKYISLSNEARNLLNEIMNIVIGNNYTRGFFLEQSYLENLYMQELFNFRIIHMIDNNYVDINQTKKTYAVFTLDYATYVHYIHEKQNLDLFKNDKIEQLYMQSKEKISYADYATFDANRRIRKVILPAELLHYFGSQILSKV